MGFLKRYQNRVAEEEVAALPEVDRVDTVLDLGLESLRIFGS